MDLQIRKKQAKENTEVYNQEIVDIKWNNYSLGIEH